jgi:hypothetical protein
VKFTISTISVLAALAAGFLFGLTVPKEVLSGAVRGETMLVDTIVVHDTLKVPFDASSIKVERRPSVRGVSVMGVNFSKEYFPQDSRERWVDSLSGKHVPAVSDSAGNPALAEDSSDVCYTFKKTGPKGAHAAMEICSKSLPSPQPEDIHGSLDIYCGEDTVRAQSRTDTVFKCPEGKSSQKTWYLAAGVVILTAIVTGFIGR